MSYHWVTNEEEEQISEEFRYLNSVDMSIKKWRDQIWIEFNPNVLDRYKNNSRCEIGNNYISFLAPRKDEDLTVNFELIDGNIGKALVLDAAFGAVKLHAQVAGHFVGFVLSHAHGAETAGILGKLGI